MYVRMSWKEAKEKFNRHEDFVITCGNKSNPYGKYARDYHVGEDNFLTANDGSVNCWKQVPDDVEGRGREGKKFPSSSVAALYAVCYIVIKNGRSGKGRVCGDFLFFTCILQ